MLCLCCNHHKETQVIKILDPEGQKPLLYKVNDPISKNKRISFSIYLSSNIGSNTYRIVSQSDRVGELRKIIDVEIPKEDPCPAEGLGAYNCLICSNCLLGLLIASQYDRPFVEFDKVNIYGFCDPVFS